MILAAFNNDLRCGALPFIAPCRNRTPAPGSLAEAIQAAVREIEDSRRLPLLASCPGIALRPGVMLGLLTCCYSRQIYSSLEVRRLLGADDTYRALCRDAVPDALQIRKFREQNRAAIQICLTAALAFVVHRKIAAGVITRANETFTAEEARRRLIMAACVDSMELDSGTWPTGSS